MHPIRKALTLTILLGVLALPALGAASAYQDYEQLKTLGQDAINHLLNAKDAIIPSKISGSASCSTTPTTTPSASPSAGAPAGPTAHPTPAPTPTGNGSGAGGTASSGGTSLPDAVHLATAQHELEAAQQEFRQLAILLDQPNPTLAFAGQVPLLAAKVTTVRQLVYVGDDVSTVGQNLLAVATPIITRLRTGALSATTQPLITAPEAVRLRAAMVGSVGLLNDVAERISGIDPNQLPVNACQRAEYVHLAGYLPEVSGLLSQAPQLFDAAIWFAGVDQSRQFLIQTLDTRELRSSGGFAGQYGALTVAGGRIKLSALHDVGYLDYNPGFTYINGRRPPALYSWWPIINWGMRDANLSPDFPTTAHLELQTFTGENGPAYLGLPSGNMDGVIQIAPEAISNVLLVTGAIQVPDYGETVTAANLVEKIDYYQNNPAGIARQNAICPASSDNSPHTKRKCFTQELAALVLEHVRQLSLSQLEQLAKIMIGVVKSKEIQVWVSNPQIESLLGTYGLASQMAATPGQDALIINQTSPSVSKNTPYINMTVHDTITLDTKGGATHHFEMDLVNTVGGNPVDGFTTFRDYLRIYVPPQAQLLDANGFDTGQPVCWVAPPGKPTEAAPAVFAGLPPCPTVGFFPDGSLSCPPGYWGPGPNPAALAAYSYGLVDWPVDNTGYPTNFVSDVSGFAMFGGFVTLPNLCTARVTLTWYVPHVALPSSTVPANAAAYTLRTEHELGTNIKWIIKVTPAAAVAGMSNTPVTYSGQLDQDMEFVIPRLNPGFGR
jgi:type II secretory pathway pseudopilin PulG